MLMEQRTRLIRRDIGRCGDKALTRHQFVDPQIRIGRETHIAIGDDANQPPRASFHHRNAADAVPVLQRAHFSQSLVRMHGQRVHHHAGFKLLHLPHLRGLIFRREILVDHANAAGLRHGNRHRGFRDGIHRRRNQRNIQPNFLGEPRMRQGLRRQHGGIGGHQQHIIKGISLSNGHNATKRASGRGRGF